MNKLELEIAHAVRQALRLLPVYSAPWEINIIQLSPTKLKIIGMLPESATLPTGHKRPLLPVQFLHRQMIPMTDLLSVSFGPIARELHKEITKAYQLGEYYGRV